MQGHADNEVELEDDVPSSAVVIGASMRDTQEILVQDDDVTKGGSEPPIESQLRPVTLPLEAPMPERLPEVLVHLSRKVGLELSDDEIVHAFVAGIRELLPGRRIVVRLFGSQRGEVSFLYATGRLQAGARDPLLLEQRAVELHAIAPRELEHRALEVTPSYVPFFAPDAQGFDVPLTESSKVIGILSVEVPSGCAVPAWDLPIVVPLALEMSSKLKSARLFRESSYLRDYLSQVIERANAPIVVLRPDRTVEHVNRAFTTITHTTREHWTGNDFVEMLSPSEHPAGHAALSAAARGEALTNIELRVPRLGGGTARISFNTASILAPEGEVAGIVAMGRDMTEVRDLEEQVIQAEKLATLGQLAAGVVHELNNPLTSISVYSDYLLTKGRRTSTEPADLEKLGRISEAAARMLRFTRDLVSYARPSSEEPLHLSMPDIVDQALVFCEHVILESHVEIKKIYSASIPRLWAVRGQLHQVFINLITNACHAIAAVKDEGILELRVTSDGSTVTVKLEDDGPGIAPEHLDHVFEPFFSTKGEGKGTGLGLSIVRNIVQQHGGTISVETRHARERTGTCFTVRLPMRPTNDPTLLSE